MKTGFSNLIEPKQGPTLTEQLEVGGMIMAFMKNAMKSAAVYVSHSGRSIVTPKDIQMALKWEVFEFLNRHTLLNDINEMTQWTMENCEVSTDGLFDKDEFVHAVNTEEDMSDDDMMEEEEDTEEEDTDEEDTGEEEWYRSACACDICYSINDAVERRWSRYQPNPGIETIMWKRINEMDCESL